MNESTAQVPDLEQNPVTEILKPAPIVWSIISKPVAGNDLDAYSIVNDGDFKSTAVIVLDEVGSQDNDSILRKDNLVFSTNFA